MKFTTKRIAKHRGRQEIPAEWKIPITGLYCGITIYLYSSLESTSGWPAVGLLAVAVGAEKVLQFWWGPRALSNPSVKPTR